MIEGEWITSSLSSGHGQCVQAKRQLDKVQVRDSQHSSLCVIAISGEEWQAWVDTLKASIS